MPERCRRAPCSYWASGACPSQGFLSHSAPSLSYSCPHGKKVGADFCDLGILNESVFYNHQYLCVNSLLIVPVVNSSPTLHWPTCTSLKFSALCFSLVVEYSLHVSWITQTPFHLARSVLTLKQQSTMRVSLAEAEWEYTREAGTQQKWVGVYWWAAVSPQIRRDSCPSIDLVLKAQGHVL